MTLRLGDTLIAGAGANQDLSNLASTGKNIANWSSNVTNCITEIPQDIKLELNNGTLILKAGSKVYVPNGAGVFDVVTISSDISMTNLTYNTTYLLFTTSDTSFLFAEYSASCSSGTTQPSGTWKTWYDTTNNRVKRFGKVEGTVLYEGSLPIAIITVSNGAISSIDQIFNGFGDIDSTVFALPGVKGLIPNGRNADGSLKSIEFEISNVLTTTLLVSGWNGRWSLYFNDSSVNVHPTELEYISDTKPTGVYTPTAYWYCPLDNKLYFTRDTGATWTQSNELHCVDFTENNTKITSLTPKTPFHTLDYNDSPTISGWSMPSSRYINLTLGASGATYTAPANGWVICRRTSTAVGQELQITNSNSGSASQFFIQSGKASGVVGVCLPVKKGDVFNVAYTLGSSTNQIFRFIYAEGELNV